jgi:hypothetical protein
LKGALDEPNPRRKGFQQIIVSENGIWLIEGKRCDLALCLQDVVCGKLLAPRGLCHVHNASGDEPRSCQEHNAVVLFDKLDNNGETPNPDPITNRSSKEVTILLQYSFLVLPDQAETMLASLRLMMILRCDMIADILVLRATYGRTACGVDAIPACFVWRKGCQTVSHDAMSDLDYISIMRN